MLIQQDQADKKPHILGVPYLENFWSRQASRARGVLENESAEMRKFDRVIIDGLGLPIEETLGYLLQVSPSFEEFERWILEKSNGYIDPLIIKRINCAIDDEAYSEELTLQIRAVEELEPVLSPEDIEFWNEHGYVILRQAISRDMAKTAEDAVWQFLGMDPLKKETWNPKAIGKGIMTNLYRHPALDANRRSRRIHKAFAQLWETADLWMTTDRAGFNPPETSRWKFPGPKLHWDMNLSPPYHFDVLGLIYLCDTSEEQGAFCCVPGFHKRLETWLDDLPPGADPREQDLSDMAVPIAGKAGDLIMWHQFLPHGSSPNRAAYPRIVQYLTMYPLRAENNENWK